MLIDGMDFSHVCEFVYDGCHKIWLIENQEDIDKMAEYGWDESDHYPVEQLPMVWAQTCPLRFIQTVSFRDVIPQCHEDPVTFEHEGISVTVDFG